ncbi:MAG: M15 family metallopeptidase [Spirochaetaceae bacterium]|nr:M15 family metallopeptidase [Spirochaetaceae bacterium]
MRKYFLPIMTACALAAACAGDKPLEDSGPPSGDTRARQIIHSSFNLDSESLAGLLSGLPAANRDAILAEARDFLGLMESLLSGARTSFQDPGSLLFLVDKKHPLPEGWEPGGLARLAEYPLRLSRDNLELRGIVMDDLLAMNQAAQADGVNLLLSSTYRSAAYQKTVYERNVRELGQAAADRESARPRHSQHQLGTVIDFGSISDDFTGTKMERWLDANAADYGFSLSFPEGYEELTGYRHESWHFRYIGRPAARMCGRFFGGIQQIMLEFLRDRGNDFAAAFRGNAAF